MQGNRKAMHDLAVAYAEGQGVARDSHEAVRWFARAASLGYVDSQFDLAVLYERGDGVPQSLFDAFKWYMIASAQGDADARARLDVLRTRLLPENAEVSRRAALAFRAEPHNLSANVEPNIETREALNAAPIVPGR